MFSYKETKLILGKIIWTINLFQKETKRCLVQIKNNYTTVAYENKIKCSFTGHVMSCQWG